MFTHRVYIVIKFMHAIGNVHLKTTTFLQVIQGVQVLFSVYATKSFLEIQNNVSSDSSRILFQERYFKVQVLCTQFLGSDKWRSQRRRISQEKLQLSRVYCKFLCTIQSGCSFNDQTPPVLL